MNDALITGMKTKALRSTSNIFSTQVKTNYKSAEATGPMPADVTEQKENDLELSEQPDFN